jgi:hypothetical protein
MVLIDYSDLDDLVNKLNLQTINDPELLSKFIPKEYLPLVPQLSLRVILDNLANQLLARCLITQSRLHFGKDEEYEDRITRLSLD